ncbi:hypothetical protein [Flocculibacter collagenilyticus]|uniref:hypothetical protein n=1 Tax=Flocculibacter collagenilyticus TaxID=2744479 RepID=UPI0018F61D2B|nr:hypothetical protein [Flocculibacter collagenilyticus]
MAQVTQWKALTRRFSQLAKREKVIIFCAVLFLIVYLPMMYLIVPAIEQHQALAKQTRDELNQLSLKSNQLNTLRQRVAHDPNIALRTEIEALKRQQRQQSNELAALSQDFIPPEAMATMLSTLLERANQLQLIELKALTPLPVQVHSNVTTATDSDLVNAEKASDTQLYQHRITMKVSGQYFDLQRYLKAMDELPRKFKVVTFNYQVTEYPVAVLSLELATLSTNEKIITI